eukprot:TRINITY_DN1890_c0_g1_i1.p1 TRINITY_DN1890_c0_g1~~TRINITY_DN1890_c0_g1_i1.p1  ORF type:complete len:475 (+),score=177.74 TRINITY_DN1890_c0_g1_i1:83-1426(+)
MPADGEADSGGLPQRWAMPADGEADSGGLPQLADGEADSGLPQRWAMPAGSEDSGGLPHTSTKDSEWLPDAETAGRRSSANTRGDADEDGPPQLLHTPEAVVLPHANLEAALVGVNVPQVLDAMAQLLGAQRVAEECTQWLSKALSGSEPRVASTPVSGVPVGRCAVSTPDSAMSNSPSPAFEHRGRVYPAGLNRRQRRAILFGTAKERERLGCPTGDVASPGEALGDPSAVPLTPVTCGAELSPAQPMACRRVASVPSPSVQRRPSTRGSPGHSSLGIGQAPTTPQLLGHGVPFMHQGRLYPAGLNRKQRRAIQFGSADECARLNCPEGTPVEELPGWPAAELPGWPAADVQAPVGSPCTPGSPSQPQSLIRLSPPSGCELLPSGQPAPEADGVLRSQRSSCSDHSRFRFGRPALDRSAVGVHQSVLDDDLLALPPPQHCPVVGHA